MSEQLKGSRRLDALRELCDGDLMEGLDYVAAHLPGGKIEGQVTTPRVEKEAISEPAFEAPVIPEVVSIVERDSSGVEHEYRSAGDVSEAELRAYAKRDIQQPEESQAPFAPQPSFGQSEQLPGVLYPAESLRSRIIDNFHAMSRGKKVVAMGASAVVLTAGLIVTPNMMSHNDEGVVAPVDEVSTDQPSAEQASGFDRALFEACTNENSFSSRVLEQTYSAAAGLEWVLPNGKTYGPDAGRTVSVVVIPEGELQVTLCDDDDAVTVKNTEVTVDLAKVTTLTQVVSGKGDAKTQFVPIVDSDTVASGENADDIEQLKKYMKDTSTAAVQTLALQAVKENLENDASLFENDALKRANKAARATAEQRLKDLAPEQEYTLKVKGELSNLKVVAPQTDMPNYVAVDQVDMTVGEQ